MAFLFEDDAPAVKKSKPEKIAIAGLSVKADKDIYLNFADYTDVVYENDEVAKIQESAYIQRLSTTL